GPHDVRPGDIFLLCSDGLSGPVADSEIGAVASVLPPAEACQFLVDLANLRGGPDNITVLIIKVGGTPEGNGVAGSPPPPRKPRRKTRLPWWVGSLFAGTVLAVGAVFMVKFELPAAELIFVLAAVAIIAGLVGLFQYYQKEKGQVL